MQEDPATFPESTIAKAGKQAPKSGYGFLEAVLDSLDDGPLLEALQRCNHTGRPGYSVRAMWRAFLSKYVLTIRYNLELLERLRGSAGFREVCGFSEGVPSESTFSRFVTRLSKFEDLVKQCLTGVTDEIREVLPRCKEDGPELGEVVVVDSTIFPSFSNPNRSVVSDPDAAWGLKNSSKSKDGKKEWMWGYRMHLLADATYGLVLEFIITSANEGDSPHLRTVMRKAHGTYDWFKPQYLLADKGYDSRANHEYLVNQGVTPIIHIRKPSNTRLHDGIYDKEGTPTCMGGVPMEYIRTDPDNGFHLFRCVHDGCHLKTKTNGATRHCDTEHWEDPADNWRVIGRLPRSSKKWKKFYAQRMIIERMFRSLKHSRGLEQHRVRRMNRIVLHATMSLLTYQATALTRFNVGDVVNIRRMRVKVS